MGEEAWQTEVDSALQGRVKASVGCGSDHTTKDPHMVGDCIGKLGALLTTRRLQRPRQSWVERFHESLLSPMRATELDWG